MKVPNLTALCSAGLMTMASALVPHAAFAEDVIIDLTNEMLEICDDYGVNGAACACYLDEYWEDGNIEFTADDVDIALSESDVEGS